MPVKTEQITMQLQCKKDTYKELEINLDEYVQSVLTGAGITVVSWRIASGSGVVSLEKITPNKAGKTTAKIKGHKAGKATMECYIEDEQGNFYVLGRFHIRVLAAKTEVRGHREPRQGGLPLEGASGDQGWELGLRVSHLAASGLLCLGPQGLG